MSNSSNIVPFSYDGTEVRVVSVDGEPWFVLADLCKVLDISNVSQLKDRLDDGVSQTHPIEDSMGRTQQATVVSESGMYEVVIRSDKPEAVSLRRWITGSVLPEIRQTGSYGAKPSLSGPGLLAHAVLEAAAMIEAKDAEIAELGPKAEFFDRVMAAEGTYTFAEAAQLIGWGRNTMMHELRRSGMLQQNNLPYSRYSRHFKVVPGTRQDLYTGATIPTTTTHVLPSGLQFIERKLKDNQAVTA